MRIFSKGTLAAFWEKHPDSEQPLRAWYHEAKKAGWKTPHDIKAMYPQASIVGGQRVVFNICGNLYRLIVKAEYEKGWVFVRFIGTHAEYDKVEADKV
jgi:mRNA interferase HigB